MNWVTKSRMVEIKKLSAWYSSEFGGSGEENLSEQKTVCEKLGIGSIGPECGCRLRTIGLSIRGSEPSEQRPAGEAKAEETAHHALLH